MAKNKTSDILSSLHPYAKVSKQIEQLRSQNPLIISWTNPLQHKAMMKLLEQIENLVEATANNTWMDVIPEWLFDNLPAQIIQTPNNGITKDANTGNVVIKDNSWDYVTVAWSPWAARFSALVNMVANVPQTILHSLGTPDVVVMARDSVTNNVVYPEISIVDSNTISVTSTASVLLRVTCI